MNINLMNMHHVINMQNSNTNETKFKLLGQLKSKVDFYWQSSETLSPVSELHWLPYRSQLTLLYRSQVQEMEAGSEKMNSGSDSLNKPGDSHLVSSVERVSHVHSSYSDIKEEEYACRPWLGKSMMTNKTGPSFLRNPYIPLLFGPLHFRGRDERQSLQSALKFW